MIKDPKYWADTLEDEYMLLNNQPGLVKNPHSLQITLLAITLIFVIFGSSVLADGGMPIQDTIVFKVPDNLASMSTQEIKEMREARQQDLEKTEADANAEQKAEEKLFEQLMDHDLVRLSIADVITELINEYGIDGEFKDTLLGYQKTFSEDLMSSRESVENLEDYPSYDFRFAAVYMSMLYSFQKYPDFYEQLKLDMVNEKTPIGSYKKTLDDSYGGVVKARAEMDFMKSSNDLKKVIAALDEELERRSH